MSLINKMLQDLEARKNAPLGKPGPAPIFRDLHAVSDHGLRRWVAPLVAGGALLMLSLAAWYTWTHRSNDFSSRLAASKIDAPAVLPAAPAVTPPPPVVEAVNAERPTDAAVIAPAAAPPVTTSVEVANRATTAPVKTVPDGTSPVTDKPATPRSPQIKATAPVVTPKPAPPAQASTAVQMAEETSPEPASNLGNESAGSIEKRVLTLTPEQRAENRYRAATQQMQQRQLVDAEQGLRAALEEYPRHVGARDLLAALLLDQGRMDDARQVLEQGLVVLPGHAGFAILLARIYVEQNTEPKAITMLEQQRRGSKPNPDTLALLATLYQRAARHSEAIAAFKDALTLRPLEGKWWLGLGISQEAEQNWNEARFAYQRVRDTDVEPRLARYAEQRLAIVRTK